MSVPGVPQGLSDSIVTGTLPEPFTRKAGGVRKVIALPMPDDEAAAYIRPSELACEFADAVDVIEGLSSLRLTEEAEAVVMVRLSAKELRRWLETFDAVGRATCPGPWMFFGFAAAT